MMAFRGNESLSALVSFRPGKKLFSHKNSSRIPLIPHSPEQIPFSEPIFGKRIEMIILDYIN
jgi:hypothetical protein